MTTLLSCYFTAQAINAHLDSYEAEHRALVAQNASLRDSLDETERCKIIATTRQELAQHINNLPPKDLDKLLSIDPVFTTIERLRGTLFDTPLTQEEIDSIHHNKAQLETPEGNTEEEKALHQFQAYVILSLYHQPFDLSRPTWCTSLPSSFMGRTLGMLFRQPHLMREEDEDTYLSFYKEMGAWLLAQITESDAWEKPKQRAFLQTLKTKLTFGACYYLDRPIIAIVQLRAALVKAILERTPHELETYHKSLKKQSQAPTPHKKIRLGILSRNLGDYTDTRALFAMFHAFDLDRYEIYWYSLDVFDPSTKSDVHFFRNLYTLIHKAVSLRGDASHMAQTIMADDLDIFAIGTAYSFGLRDLDRLLYHKLGRVQVALSELVPGSSGFPSYDILFVPQSDDATQAIYRAESTEKLVPLSGPVLWYEKKNKVPASPTITREALGIPENAVVYCSGAAANKQMAGTIRTWLKIIENVPNSVLLFYPFNPAWGGYYIGLTFLARLRALLRDFPTINPDRIIIAREVSPDDGDRLIQLCDIYLGSFPRGGATSAMLALRYGKPVVARKETWIHSHDDAVMLRCLGCEELIGATNEDVTRIASALGNDKAHRAKWKETIASRIETAPFFAIEEASITLQSVIDTIAPKPF